MADEPTARPRRGFVAGLFPTIFWLALASLAVAVAYAGWRALVSGGGLTVFLVQLAWPGGAIFAAVLVVAVAGWKLDID